MNSYQVSGYVGEFSLIQNGSAFHIVPKASKNASGFFEDRRSLLDYRVTFDNRRRTALEMLEALTLSISQASSRRTVVGTIPQNVLRQTFVQDGAGNESARAVLVRTLAATHRQLSWQLLCDPNQPPFCALNLYFAEMAKE